MTAPTSGPAGFESISHSTYSTLVRGDADLIGHVAYALYKRDKLKFCDAFASKYGRRPSTDEVGVFIASSNLDTRIDGYRSQAETLLERMTEYQLEDAVMQIKADADASLLRKLSQAKPSRGADLSPKHLWEALSWRLSGPRSFWCCTQIRSVWTRSRKKYLT